MFDNGNQSNKEPEDSTRKIVPRVEASLVECEAAGTSHSGVEQPTTKQAERRQQKLKERKGKQRQRKRATAHATLEEALARVDTARASLDTLDTLDAAIVLAKRIYEHGGASSSTDALVGPSSASMDLPELLRQAEQKSLNLRHELRVVAEDTAVDLLEKGLVRLAVAESSGHT
jgi:hypothetical protein